MPHFNKKTTSGSIQLKNDGLVRLNKYIANSGIGSRRDADNLIKSGKVQVNSNTIIELGVLIDPASVVTVRGKKIRPQQNSYYVLNKPKYYNSTRTGNRDGKTVNDLIKEPGTETLNPLGILDRSTTGVLLLTNDIDLTNAFTQHYNNNKVEKVYKIILSKSIKPVDFNRLSQGIELEDGFIKPEQIALLEKGENRELGIAMHSGENLIIRSMFKALGYEINYLDRTSFGGITKKNLKRGQYRKLTFSEISMLKQFEKGLV